jgi:hypothetical protein
MVENIFPIGIYRSRFPDINFIGYLCKYVIPKLEFGGGHPTMYYGIKSTKGFSNLDANTFKPLTDFIEKSAQQCWTEFGYFPDIVPRLLNSFINCGEPNSSSLSHHHYDVPLTAVLYLSASPEQGNLVLENPMDLILRGQPIERQTQHTRHEVELHTGDLIIVPGFLKHYTLPNKTNDQRIVFVADIGK